MIGFGKKPIHLFLLFAFSHTVISEKTPKISYISENQLGEIGHSAILKCSIDNAERSIMRWTKLRENEPPLILTEGVTVNDPLRFSLTYNASTSTSIFQINSYQESDAGTYECILILSPKDQIKSRVELHTRKLLRINSITPSMKFYPHQNITLECYASGYPEPEIYWTRDWNKLFQNGSFIYRGSKLEIYNAGTSDNGTYICNAGNGVNRPITSPTILTMMIPPIVSVSQIMIAMPLKSTAELKCHVNKCSSWSLVWKKNGKLLNYDSILNTQTTSISDDGSTTITLRFLIESEDQFGLYSCIVTNEVAESVGNIYLYETAGGEQSHPEHNHQLLEEKSKGPQPIISFISKDQYVNYGNNVEIHCSVKNVERFLVRWVKMKRNGQSEILTESTIVRDRRFVLKYNENTTTYTLQIFNFKKSDEGTYECILPLSLTKQIKASVKIRKKEIPFINGITSPVEALFGENITLQCYAKGWPEPMIMWMRDKARSFSSGNIVYRGNMVTIPNVKKYDEGLYFCHADNGIGAPDIRNVSLTIFRPPFITTVDSTLRLELYTPLTLTCRIESYPLSKVEWKKDGYHLAIHDSRYLHTSSVLEPDGCLMSSVEFVLKEKEQFGNYSCIATNNFGVGEQTFFVYDIRAGYK